MDDGLRRAWTQIVTAEDYEQHMAAIGQAQAAASLIRHLIESAGLAGGARVVMVGAGTGQMLDYVDGGLLRPFHLTFTDLNARFLARLGERLSRAGLEATILEDDIEQTTLESGPELVLASLLLEHIDWQRGVEVFARLSPTACGVVIQENPPGMRSSITPGRRVPPSMAQAMETAHATLVPRDQLVAAFEAVGYRCADACERTVADEKRLVGMLFVRR
jgi:hypothetical protein